MKCIIKCCLLLYFIITYQLTNAQSATGLYLGEYSGIHGSIVNPASGRLNHLKWDANISSLHVFGHTDYAYALNTNLFHFIRNLETLQQVPLNSDRTGLDPDLLYYDYKEGNSPSSGSILMDITGPSFLINLNKYSIGFFTRLRAQGGAHHIAEGLNFNRFQNSSIGEAVEIDRAKAAALGWTEYGISFSSDQLLPSDWSFGVNIKYLNGHQGAHTRTIDPLSYERIGADSLSLTSPRVDLGFTNSLLEDQSSPLGSNGWGLGIDLGASKSTSYGIINLSILDLGSIGLNNAEMYRLVASGDVTLETSALESAPDVRSFVDNLDDQVSQSIGVNSTYLGDKITIGLPTRLHLDFSYPLKQHVFLGASWDQRIPVRKTMIEAENQLSVFPRYETKWWMFSMPLTLYEYKSLRIGAAMRLAFLTIGTDHILSLFGKSDFRGSSFYTAIKIFPFRKKSSSGNSGRGRDVNCPEVKN